jgi:hypothetical protein
MAGTIRYVASLLAVSGLLAQTPAPPDFVLHFDVNLVPVDAVVADVRGNQISDLKADDFEVQQDGRSQKLTHFSYLAGERRAVSAQPRLPGPHIPVAAPGRAEVRHTTVFLPDDAGMGFGEFQGAREACSAMSMDACSGAISPRWFARHMAPARRRHLPTMPCGSTTPSSG